MKRIALSLGLLLFLGGCGIFGKDEVDAEPPAELESFKATLKVRKAWSTGVGGGAKKLRLGLVVASDGTNVYAASRGGNVSAYQAGKGRRVWTVKTKESLSAGPGVGEGTVVVGTSDGDVIALAAADGTILWQVEVGGEVLAPPVISRGRVVLRTVDGELQALALDDGSPAWLIEHNVPRLSLRGNASPAVTGNEVVSGFDDGRLAAVSLANGQVLWEVSLAPPSGRTELERMVDVDSRPLVIGGDVFSTSYNGRTVKLALETGQILWSKDVASYSGLGADWNNVYIARSDSAVVAVSRRMGEFMWTQPGLLYRMVTAPVPYGNTVVLGDFEGYLHFLDNKSGEFVARAKTGEAINNPPLVVGDLLYVLTEDGKLIAYKASFGSE